MADAGAPGVDVRITAVQRTGPVVRVSAETLTGGVPLRIGLPHLHHDVSYFIAGAALRLRLMQFSVYPCGERAATPATLPTPVLIGRERERGRLG